jgi:hypothetical protein
MRAAMIAFRSPSANVSYWRKSAPLRVPRNASRRCARSFVHLPLSVDEPSVGERKKRLPVSRLPKFNFHTFATIWLPFYIG